MKRNTIFFILSVCMLCLTACSKGSHVETMKYNSPGSKEIHIGVAYPSEEIDRETYFNEGLMLAVDSVNSSGGILGKTLVTDIRDDKADPNLARQIAQTFYEQGITAVIGHWGTNVCYFVEDIYENNKTVMLTPDATGLNLFEEEYQYIYRQIGNNQVFSEAIASYMDGEGFQRVAIYFEDDEYGRNFAEILERELVKYKIKVVDRVMSITSANVDTVMQRWSAFGIDGVFMASIFPDYIEPIQLIRDVNLELPIFGADNFERTIFTEALGCSTDEIYVASLQMDSLDPDFLECFRTRYGHEPDIHAVSAYECVYLLRDAIEAIGSIDGTAIAEYLSNLSGYQTILGIRDYNADTQEFDGYNVYVRELGEPD